MKANVPEKLYVDVHDNLSDSILYGFTEKRTNDDIEYIRTDAFIEKACKWLKSKGGFTIGFPGATRTEFIQYMKEERL